MEQNQEERELTSGRKLTNFKNCGEKFYKFIRRRRSWEESNGLSRGGAIQHTSVRNRKNMILKLDVQGETMEDPGRYNRLLS